MTQSPVLEFRNTTVRFGAFNAVDDFSLGIYPGEIVALLGHNGAGKSTLINVATGAVRATEGEILLDGVAFPRNATPSKIAALGLTVVHQEPALVPELSVLDNLYLGRRGRSAKVDKTKASKALELVGAERIDLSTPLATLPLGDRQLVDLARGALNGNIKVLFLDEPTAALGEAETRALHSLIQLFAEQGTAIVYVSHRLPDVLAVSHRIVVMRSGRLVLDRPAPGMNLAELSEALSPGLKLQDRVERSPGQVALEVRHPFDMSFREGEIVGLYGMAGGEQFRLLTTLFGLGGDASATIAGAAYSPRSPSQAIRQGVHYVPADREKDGLISGSTAMENVYLPWLAQGWSSREKRLQAYKTDREKLQILGPDGDAPIGSFSGGNRQKHLLARWMFPVRPKILLLAQPTQGVDVGAKLDIRNALEELAADGVTIVVASAETDEVSLLCHRSYVVRDGQSVEVAHGPQVEARLLHTLLELT